MVTTAMPATATRIAIIGANLRADTTSLYVGRDVKALCPRPALVGSRSRRRARPTAALRKAGGEVFVQRRARPELADQVVDDGAKSPSAASATNS
jgi:hypothetical protein